MSWKVVQEADPWNPFGWTTGQSREHSPACRYGPRVQPAPSKTTNLHYVTTSLTSSLVIPFSYSNTPSTSPFNPHDLSRPWYTVLSREHHCVRSNHQTVTSSSLQQSDRQLEIRLQAARPSTNRTSCLALKRRRNKPKNPTRRRGIR